MKASPMNEADCCFWHGLVLLFRPPPNTHKNSLIILIHLLLFSLRFSFLSEGFAHIEESSVFFRYASQLIVQTIINNRQSGVQCTAVIRIPYTQQRCHISVRSAYATEPNKKPLWQPFF